MRRSAEIIGVAGVYSILEGSESWSQVSTRRHLFYRETS
jgi:hypothetical protein